MGSTKIVTPNVEGISNLIDPRNHVRSKKNYEVQNDLQISNNTFSNHNPNYKEILLLDNLQQNIEFDEIVFENIDKTKVCGEEGLLINPTKKKKCKFSFVKTDAKTRGGMGLWLSSENGEHTIKFEDSMLMVSCS